MDRLKDNLLANERLEEESHRREGELRNKLSSYEAEASSLRATLKSQQTHTDTIQQGKDKLSREVRHKNEEVSRLNEQLIEFQNKHSKVSYRLQ